MIGLTPFLSHAASMTSLVDMSLEELTQVQVTSVSGREESLSQAAASIYVITAEDIRRSSAATLAEALRLAPNLLVSRFDAGTYGISARGFNTNIADKLLVLVDGRTIYSPLFSGVFWDAQDVMLEDVERIEVISGPAGSQWGTNAVNGVVNVITRSSADTQGQVASVQLGNRESAAAVRHGGKFGDNGTYRVYGKAWDAGNFTRNAGPGAADSWKRQQAGFRADWAGGRDKYMLQGGAFDGESGTRRSPGAGQAEVSGFNLLGRWSRTHDDGSKLQLQGYVDFTRHKDALLLDENGELFDIEAQHLLAPWGAHSVQWGAGLRHARDRSDPGTLFAFAPANRTLNWANVFAQDQIQLARDWQLTLGTRFEHNGYTGWETLPNARLGWNVSRGHFLWTALSRAVRAPSRLDREIVTPPRPPYVIAGGPNFVSEIAKVFEIGYRGQPYSTFSYSVTYFNQRYDRLRSAQLAPVTVVPITFANGNEGSVNGLESWAYWQALPAWRLSGGYTMMDTHLRASPGSNDPNGPRNLGNNPDYQWMVRSLLNVTPTQEFDVGVRRVASLPPYPGTAIPVPGYTAVDLRYGWRVNRSLELSVVAQNAFDPWHREWGDTTSGSAIGRSIFVKAVWRRF